MITNADMTIFNRKANPETKRMEYCRTVVKDVHWFSNMAVSTAISGLESGLKSADVFKIRVPTDNRKDNYLAPEQYAALPWGEHKKYWTVENGDIVVKGVVGEDISKPSELASKHLTMFEVVSHADNRRGLNPHIRIGGM